MPIHPDETMTEPAPSRTTSAATSLHPISAHLLEKGLVGLARYVGKNGGIGYEGTSSIEQCLYLAGIVAGLKPRHIADVGFNAGHSAFSMLMADPYCHVTSFDLGVMPCVQAGKRYIDSKFPGRHELVIGDTRDTLTELFESHTPGEVKFDFCFIDGGHEFGVVANDLAYLRGLSPLAPLVIDDLSPWTEWGAGPSKAWYEFINVGLAEQIELVQDGEVVTMAKPPGKRVWALGRFK